MQDKHNQLNDTIPQANEAQEHFQTPLSHEDETSLQLQKQVEHLQEQVKSLTDKLPHPPIIANQENDSSPPSPKTQQLKETLASKRHQLKHKVGNLTASSLDAPPIEMRLD